ncbi:hypothetical protein QO058_29605 (plasmid) [Bosea vestrisii]|uniref:hypothetical protein n=1 Tax=Bosea vestrisii TaxID=151416 RepID=UPI0024DFB5B7|nr:hypothetical protein [Bosea vestrisii]WID99884.1 hypothetical protein QO058_29605 [Bosea vestrisii]
MDEIESNLNALPRLTDLRVSVGASRPWLAFPTHRAAGARNCRSCRTTRSGSAFVRKGLTQEIVKLSGQLDAIVVMRRD